MGVRGPNGHADGLGLWGPPPDEGEEGVNQKEVFIDEGASEREGEDRLGQKKKRKRSIT